MPGATTVWLHRVWVNRVVVMVTRFACFNSPLKNKSYLTMSRPVFDACRVRSTFRYVGGGEGPAIKLGRMAHEI